MGKKRFFKVKDNNQEEDMSEPEAAKETLEEIQEEGEEVEVEEEQTEEADDSFNEARAEAEENYDKYVRAIAELDNLKKRNIKERAELIKYSGEGLARDMLEVYDHLQLAVSQDENATKEDILQGVEMVLDKFIAIFEQHNIKRISGLNKDFDPTTHEALASQPTDEHKPGKVIEEFKKAFMFKDRLLRPGQVVVAAEPEEENSTVEKEIEDE